METQLFYLLIFPLAVLQTIVGVGVLVLGTPLFNSCFFSIFIIFNGF